MRLVGCTAGPRRGRVPGAKPEMATCSLGLRCLLSSYLCMAFQSFTILLFIELWGPLIALRASCSFYVSTVVAKFFFVYPSHLPRTVEVRKTTEQLTWILHEIP